MLSDAKHNNKDKNNDDNLLINNDEHATEPSTKTQNTKQRRSGSVDNDAGDGNTNSSDDSTTNENVIVDESAESECSCKYTCCEYRKLYDNINNKIFAYVERINSLTSSNKQLLSSQQAEREDMKKSVVSNVISSVINLHNTVINAKNSMSEHNDNNSTNDGIALNVLSVVLTQIEMVLKEYRVRQIAPKKGDAFNVNMHNVVNVEKVEDESLVNTVASLVSVGYFIAQSEDADSGISMLIQPAAVIIYICAS